MSVTLKFQSSGAIPGDAQPVQMQGGSLTVGRGPTNDLVLPDPEKMLSKNHFVIEDHNGNVVIVDLSTNGTFLNYSKIPLGQIATPLNNGDVLSVGSYELIVEIAGELVDLGDLIAAPAAPEAASHGIAENAPDPLAMLDDAGPGGDFLDDLLGGEGGPTGPSQLNPVDPIDDLLPPLGEEEDPFFQKPDTGREGDGGSMPMHSPSAHDAFVPPVAVTNLIPDDWDDDLLGGAQKAPELQPETVVPAPKSLAGDPFPAAVDRQEPVHSEPEPMLVSPKTPAATPEKAATPAGDSDAARAFLEAFGADEVAVSDEDLVNTMARMGRVTKALVTGLREILMTRTSIKSEFRIEQTMINAGGNNPLKFSISPEQAIEAMVRPATKGYQSPETATEEALKDIKAHEVAMVTGMEAALKGILAKLDPEVLAGTIETSGGFGTLLRGKKARYWEVYEKLYAEISDQAENDFHDLFSREFARAYKEQLDRLK